MMVATNPGTFRAMLRCQRELQLTLNRLSLQAEETHQTRGTGLGSEKNSEGRAETTVQDISLHILRSIAKE